MKKLLLAFISMMIFSSGLIISAPGDTTLVRTIDFNKVRQGWYEFPNSTENYRKIIMNYKLKCPDGKPCGEWDYIANVYVDYYFAPNYRLNGVSADSAAFMKDTSWNFTAVKEDNQWVVKKTPKDAIVLQLFKDGENPTKATETRMVWPTYYTYTFQDSVKTDSTLVAPDSVLKLTKTPVDWSDSVTVTDSYEVFRYITPYGNGLNMGDGWTWHIDVTDFMPMLHGKLHLSATRGGWGDPYDQTSQENLELTFSYIEGTPERNVKSITRLWNLGSVTYDGTIENYLTPYNVQLTGDEAQMRLKVIQTGHGFGGNNDNCSEFCKKSAYVKMDGDTIYKRDIWRECADIPLYPQGGTWLYDRTNWCPGMEVEYHDYELSNYVGDKSVHSLDYDMQYYNTKWTPGSGGNERPYWVISSYLIKYGDFNFDTDAEIKDIIAPTNYEMHNRFNPYCGGPLITVHNSGKSAINSLTIDYAINGGNKVQTVLSGLNIKPLEDADINLNPSDYNANKSNNKFEVWINKVNDKEDDYTANNYGTSTFQGSDILDSVFVVTVKTNNYDKVQYPSPYQYTVYDVDGKKVFDRGSTDNNAVYIDTLHLPYGCYSFQIVNPYGYGLGFWVLNQNNGMYSGSMDITTHGISYKNFNPDFGNFLIYNFRVGAVPQIVTDVPNDTLDVGSVKVGSDTSITVKITPSNNKGLTVKSVSVPFSSATGFSVLSTEPAITGGGYALEFGDTMAVNLKFTPKKVGVINAKLSLGSNDEYLPTKQINLYAVGKDTSVGVTDLVQTQFGVKISQNPIVQSASLHVSTDNPNQKATILIMNPLGMEVAKIYEGYVNYETDINHDFSDLPAGAYYVVVRDNTGSLVLPVIISR